LDTKSMMQSLKSNYAKAKRGDRTR